MSYTKAYHYTHLAAAQGIINDERIRRMDTLLSPVVFFSTSEQFDPGAIKSVRDGKKLRNLTPEKMANVLGLVRFSTDAGVLTPYRDAVAKGLIMTMHQMHHEIMMAPHGGTGGWFVHSGSDFPLRYCTGAQVYLHGAWCEMTPETVNELRELLPGETVTNADLVA